MELHAYWLPCLMQYSMILELQFFERGFVNRADRNSHCARDNSTISITSAPWLKIGKQFNKHTSMLL